MAVWRSTGLPLIFLAAAVFFDVWISTPSCFTSGPVSADVHRPDDLKLMLVADVLLYGSDAGVVDQFFRLPFISRFLIKSLEKLKPDMIVVLGDLSSGDFERKAGKWLSVLQQFQWMLGHLVGLPMHVVLGERDVGRCGELDPEFVSRIASNSPGMDYSGCGVFEISNVSFVSLNGVALLCEGDPLRFGVERVIERESLEFRSRGKEVKGDGASFGEFQWRDNGVEPGSGPVVLVHFPLHKMGENSWLRSSEDFHSLDYSVIHGASPYEFTQTLPINATQYILQALKPRIVFSAHTHSFRDQVHDDGTREVTIPAMAWAPSIKPGFAIATFGWNKVVSVKHCSLAREADVLIGYSFVYILPIVVTLAMRLMHLRNMSQP